MEIDQLKATIQELQAKEQHWYILKDLAKPYTSLGLLNQAWNTLRNIGPPKLSTEGEKTFKAILNLVNQAIEELIELELPRTLKLIQQAIFLTYTSCIDTLDLLTLLEQTAGKIVINLALEQLIWEGNTTIV